MTDLRMRSLSRLSASGDLHAQARQLLERVRSGSLSRERLELAAYCGHQGARLAIDVASVAPWPGCGCGPPEVLRACVACGPLASLASFVGGLDWRWRTPVLVRAALAAIGPAAEFDHAERARNDRESVRRRVRVVTEAMSAWLAATERVNREAAAQEWAAITEGTPWLPDYLPRLRLPNVDERPPVVKRAALAGAIHAASDLAGDRAVLDAIKASLVSWSLGP